MDNLQLSLKNVFSSHPTKRNSLLRKNAEALLNELTGKNARFLLNWRSQHIYQKGLKPHYLTYEEAKPWIVDNEWIYLGEEGSHSFFSIKLPSEDESIPQKFEAQGTFEGLRTVALQIPAFDGGLHAYASSMLHWHKTHQFCGKCGSPSKSEEGGHQRKCINGSCNTIGFPRTDPCIIVLVTHKDRCLLGRGKEWPEGRFSALAGFIEPGESIENAVIREVYEESGVGVEKIEYQSSQPWPFPCSLMLGFRAQASTTEIQLHDQELAEAHWFSREDIAAGFKDGSIHAPTSVSIASRLMEGWFNEGSETPFWTVVESCQ